VKRVITSRKDYQLTAVVTGVVVVATLYLAKVVFIPLALALLLSFLLTPVVALIEKTKLPRGVAIFLVMTSLVCVAGFLGWKTSQQFVDLTSQIPTYKSQLVDKIHSLKGNKGQSLAKVSETVRELESEISNTAGGAAGTKAKSTPAPGSSESHPMSVEVVPPANPLESFQSMLGPIATVGIILVFTIFMLLDREDLRDRFLRIAGGGRLTAMTQALDEASRRINRYLLLQMIVNTGYGALIATGLYFIGIPNASLWGVVAGMLRFLPYAGPPMAAAMPIFLSMAIFNDWRHALETAGLFFVLEVSVSNFLEPLLYGAHVGLSALAILVAAIFWTMIWGIPGLLLSTPLTVFLVVMGRYLPSLKFFDVLLGDEPVLSPPAQFYQRLLGSEQEEAKRVLEEFLKEKPLDALYSEVVIPALNLAERARHRDELDEETQGEMYQSVRELVEDIGADLAARQESAPEGNNSGSTVQTEEAVELDTRRADVVCVPSRDDADDVVALMLAQLFDSQGHSALNVPIGPIAEMAAQVSEARPRIVCISALPPFAISHARELYRRLRQLSPEVRIVICFWNLEGDLGKTALRLRQGKGDQVFSAMQQVSDYVSVELKSQSRREELHGAENVSAAPSVNIR
jgi:predicted PurR-regulated permease PerM